MASRPIDEKIVRLTLENADFEKNAKGSVRTFVGMNKAMSNQKGMELEDARKGVEMYRDSLNATNIGAIADQAEQINDRFSLMGTFTRKVFDEIANKAITTG